MMDRRWLEVVAFVECARLVVFGVYQNSPSTDDLGSGRRAKQGVAQQGRARAPSLERPVDRKACQEHDRYRMSGHALADSSGSVRPIHASRNQGVVPNHGCSLAEDVGLSGVRSLACQGVPLQPCVEFRATTVERRNVVVGCKLLDL